MAVIRTKVTNRDNTKVRKVVVGTPIRRVTGNANLPNDFAVSLVTGDGKSQDAILTFNSTTGKFEPKLTLGDNAQADGGSF